MKNKTRFHFNENNFTIRKDRRQLLNIDETSLKISVNDEFIYIRHV